MSVELTDNRAGAGLWHSLRGEVLMEQIQRAGQLADEISPNFGVNCRASNARMAHQSLDDAQVDTGLEEVNAERMAQGMEPNRSLDLSVTNGDAEGPLKGGSTDVAIGSLAGEDPRTRGLPKAPILAKPFVKSIGEQGQTMLVAFPDDMEDATLAVYVRSADEADFTDTEASAESDNEGSLVEGGRGGVEETGNFVKGKDLRDRLRNLGPGNGSNLFGTAKGPLEEKLDAGDSHLQGER